MTFSTFVGLLAEHWVLMSLVLCTIAIVMMALAALTCEACGAPFGIFRRRQRTIDLCLRCAVLHDIRRANDARKPARESDSGSASSHPDDAGASPSSRQEDGHEERRYSTQSPIELGAAGYPAGR